MNELNVPVEDKSDYKYVNVLAKLNYTQCTLTTFGCVQSTDQILQ